MGRSHHRRDADRRQRIAAVVFVGTAAAIAVAVLWPWDSCDSSSAGRDRDEADAGAPEADDDLPETPSREQVRGPLRTLAPLVATCGKQGGVVRVHFTISGRTGSVTEATVAKQFSGTEVAKCAARIVRSAQFPRFKQKAFTVAYPFQLSKSAPTDGGAESGDGGELGSDAG